LLKRVHAKDIPLMDLPELVHEKRRCDTIAYLPARAMEGFAEGVDRYGSLI